MILAEIGAQQPPSRHREKILGHPASGNVEWRQVLSLLNRIGTTTEEHNGKVKVTLGPDTQMIVDLRRMLTQAGWDR